MSSAEVLNGKALARAIETDLTAKIVDLIENGGVVPRLVVILVGNDPASEVYVGNKKKACERVGIDGILHRLPANVSQDELISLIHRLNKDENVHGILVQTPLPAGIDSGRVLQSVHPLKDVDGFHAENVGRLVLGRPRYIPCTALGVKQLLLAAQVPVSGKHVVILGRSDTVGKPLASLLLQKGEGGDATVTVCHSKSESLPHFTRQADILVAAIGRAKFVTPDMIKPGAVVIDVGINRLEKGLVGDVDFEGALSVASKITPVPGGVGPLTVAMLLSNTFDAVRLQTEVGGR